ncbi:MAG: CvpA family protein [Flavobacteriaceae bacterium]|nr:CvpA family protein [Flavobacteriaceae bacterium]
MNWLDVILLIFLALGAWKGFMNGFLVEIASIIALIVAVYAALHFSDVTAGFLAQWITWDETTLKLLAFGITFIIVLIGIVWIARLLTKLIQIAALGWLNRMGGLAFGLAKFVLIASVLIMFFDALQNEFDLVDRQIVENAKLYAALEPIAPSILPKILPE